MHIGYTIGIVNFRSNFLIMRIIIDINATLLIKLKLISALENLSVKALI